MGAIPSPTFSALSSPTIVHGTATTTLTAQLGYFGAYPTGATVSIAFNSVTQTATVDAGGNFTTTFATGALSVAGGPYTVSYAFAGNTGFMAAADSSTAVTVTPASLTITANSDSKPYGTTKTFSPNAFTQSGLITANGDTITGVTETSTGSAPTASAAGSPYPIIPSTATGLGLSNYTIDYINGLLTVVATPPTVTTPTATSITSTIATLGGTVVTAAGSTLLSRGILYAPFALDPTPTLHDGIAIEVDDAHFTLGAFAESITGLKPSTLYSFVAFATTSQGPGYSPASQFSTTILGPVSSITGPTGGKPAQLLTFVLNGYDPSPGLQLQRFVFHIMWGDGKSNVVTALNGTQTTHAYAAAGTYTIQVSATDAVGNMLPTGTWKVTISATPAASPNVAGGGTGTTKPLSIGAIQPTANTFAVTSIPSSKVQSLATVASPAAAAIPTVNPASNISSPARPTNTPASPYSALAVVMDDWAPADEVIDQCLGSLSKTDEKILFSIEEELFLGM